MIMIMIMITTVIMLITMTKSEKKNRHLNYRTMKGVFNSPVSVLTTNSSEKGPFPALLYIRAFTSYLVSGTRPVIR